jgi:aldehyde:ferredoxin oxidoreductase
VTVGRVLYVDLTRRQSAVRPLPESYRARFVGGAGIGTRLLWDASPAGVDPLSAENALVFATGAFTGTMVPASGKFAVVTKSPLTGMIGDSLSSSGWPVALRQAGYDAIVVTGQSARPVYLFIDDDNVLFRDAAGIWGRGCVEAQTLVRDALGDANVAVASIGPAGENLVRYACIGNDFGRQAGRTGTGAVMGSKRVKAIAVRGARGVETASPADVQRIAMALIQRAQGPSTEKYRTLGTAGNVLTLDRLAALPTRNFRQSTYEDAEAVSGETLYSRNLRKVVACVGCPIACDHYYKAVEGLYANSTASLDYETLYALGPLCGVSDVGAILTAADLCDELGLDTMSAGVTIAWAMETFERGLLTTADTDGLDLRFGNAEALIESVRGIGRREGLGRLLGEGVRRAAARVGQGSDAWAMHSKGLEFPGYEPRSLKTLGLGLAVGTRGACHNRSAAYEVDMSGKLDRLSVDGDRGRYAMAQEDFAATLDALGVCKFLRRCFGDLYAESAELLTATTGVRVTADDVRGLGERVTTLKKAFNQREGWRTEDDWLPARILNESLPTGVAAGVKLSADELLRMRADYYAARGWTVEGRVTGDRLTALGLGDLVSEASDAGAVSGGTSSEAVRA